MERVYGKWGGGGGGLGGLDERIDIERVPEWFLSCSPPSLPPFQYVGYVVGSFGGKSFRGFGVNNDVEGPAASAPADNDDA